MQKRVVIVVALMLAVVISPFVAASVGWAYVVTARTDGQANTAELQRVLACESQFGVRSVFANGETGLETVIVHGIRWQASRVARCLAKVPHYEVLSIRRQ